jgi:hypothetical protein
MLKFSEYMIEAKAPPTVEKLIKKLEKTRKSIVAHANRGYMNTGQRSLDLIDRYDEITDAIKEMDKNAWIAWNKKNGSHPDHDGHDLFA